jgi:NTP pyrophosphatase (non-canonical NTP hydrolase)
VDSRQSAAISAIAERLRRRNGDGGLNVQMLCLAEEAGEVIQAYRRASGQARQPGGWAEVAAELADVVIVAHVTAELAGIDLAGAVTAKLTAIAERGGI